jgi:hypothetical protein
LLLPRVLLPLVVLPALGRAPPAAAEQLPAQPRQQPQT